MFSESHKPQLSNKLTLLLAILLFSCTKATLDEELPDNAPAANANLVVCIAKSQLSATRLNFAVYNEGTRVKQINQQSGAADFGSAVFQLEPGIYRLVVLAHSSNGNPTMTDPAKIQFKNNQGFTDTFLFDTTITVGEESQTLNVTLDRIVALCRFVINDAIPEGVTKMQFYYTGGSGAFNAATRFGCVNSKQQMTFDVSAGQEHTIYDLYTFLHHQQGTIKLIASALDAAGETQCAWEFAIPLAQNQITWTTGNFFADQPDTWAIIPTTTIDYSWAAHQYLEY